jgi:Ca2+-transporting ATPase
LVYAYKDVPVEEWGNLKAQYNNFTSEADREILERDLTLVAGFGINDDLREGVRSAISNLRAAGINTRMVSGDNI